MGRAVTQTTTDSVARQVGERLRDVRTSLGVRQAGLAGQMGVSQPYIAAVEAGRQNLTLGKIAAIASALGIDRLEAEVAAQESSLLEQLTAVSGAAPVLGESHDAYRPLHEVRLGLLEHLASLRPKVATYAEVAIRARRQLRRIGPSDVERPRFEAGSGGQPRG